MALTNRQARMALCALESHGRPEISDLLLRFEATEVWEGILGRQSENVWTRKALNVDVQAMEAATRAAGARFVVPGDPEWPAQLNDLAHVRVGDIGGIPPGLWVLGDARLHQLPRPAVAIVGSRAATSYGTVVTTDMAADLAAEGHCVISGLAYGIDAAAHRGTIAAGGTTVAVLACGIDRVYPTAHTRLHAAVQGAGAVITEVPPGAHPLKVSFLARNRLIAALSDGVVLVEAAARSGARNTTTWSKELNRQVMAVPGSVTSAMAVTPHFLIQQGEAALVTGAADVARALGPLQPELELNLRGEDAPLDKLRPELRQLREVVASGESLGVGDFSARTGLSVPACMAGAAELAESGWLEEVEPQRWALPRRHSVVE